jgi:hypothetical protein
MMIKLTVVLAVIASALGFNLQMKTGEENLGASLCQICGQQVIETDNSFCSFILRIISITPSSQLILIYGQFVRAITMSSDAFIQQGGLRRPCRYFRLR